MASRRAMNPDRRGGRSRGHNPGRHRGPGQVRRGLESLFSLKVATPATKK